MTSRGPRVIINSMDLRTTFDEDAERYDRFRPKYPAELFERLINDTGINSDSSLLEIGPGTGQATKPLAQLGADITAIELGDELTEKAQQALQQYSNVRVITGAFENTDLPVSNYDLIYSATAFHWVQDAYKFTKTAKLLKPKGHLAIVHTEHVSDNAGDAFHKESQPIYDTYWPPKENANPPKLPTLRSLKAPFIDTTFFKLQSFNVFPEVKIYSAHDYAGLLSTFSHIIALQSSRRRSFLADIENLINNQFGGTLEKHFAFTLTIAQKK
jgi:protein-L-isoaspartate O-methyltransferase